jgi:sugar lactone lactonase YvrE
MNWLTDEVVMPSIQLNKLIRAVWLVPLALSLTLQTLGAAGAAPGAGAAVTSKGSAKASGAGAAVTGKGSAKASGAGAAVTGKGSAKDSGAGAAVTGKGSAKASGAGAAVTSKGSAKAPGAGSAVTGKGAKTSSAGNSQNASPSSTSNSGGTIIKAEEEIKELVPSQRFLGKPEVVAAIKGAMPTGVAVSFSGRKFLNFPRWEEGVENTCCELRDGALVPYPNAEINKLQLDKVDSCLVSVQSVVIDPRDRLWLLDTGSIKFGAVQPGAAKMVCVDLGTNKVVKVIKFPADVALPTSYLNDMRFDLRRGKSGMAFLTDSSSSGNNALVVVDLETGESFRRLAGHVSTKAVPGFLPIVEGAPLMFVSEDGERTGLRVGADGIAIGADGKHLFYCPLSSRKLYSVNLDLLCDRSISDDEVAKSVCEVAEKGASDGLESDSAGRIYATDYEHNAVHRISLKGEHETLVCDPRVLWPDTLCLAQDGYLYFTANQLHRQPFFHGGKDLREKPYILFRVKVDAEPVYLR